MRQHRHKQKCPLCDTPSEYQYADRNKRKHFFCPYCTEYQITDIAEKKLKTAPQEWRMNCSAKAKSIGPEMVLLIFVPAVQRIEGFLYESLRGKPMNREEYCYA